MDILQIFEGVKAVSNCEPKRFPLSHMAVPRDAEVFVCPVGGAAARLSHPRAQPLTDQFVRGWEEGPEQWYPSEVRLA